MNSLTKILLGFFSALLVGMTIGIVSRSSNNNSSVYVQLDQPLTVYVYPDLGSTSSSNYNYNRSAKPAAVVSHSGYYSLAKGTYDFVIVSNQSSYQNPVTKAIVGNYAPSVEINPQLTSAKLNTLLSSDRPTIQQALLKAYPSLLSNYSLGNDRLFEHGDWYGIRINPKNSSLDPLVSILHLQKGQWTVAASPEISIGSPSYPAIPFTVIDQTDQL